MTYQKDFKKALLSKPHVILGKSGITEEFVAHALKLLKKHKIIKIKTLKSATQSLDIDELANQLCIATDSHLLDVRGRIFIISMYPIKKKINPISY